MASVCRRTICKYSIHVKITISALSPSFSLTLKEYARHRFQMDVGNVSPAFVFTAYWQCVFKWISTCHPTARISKIIFLEAAFSVCSDGVRRLKWRNETRFKENAARNVHRKSYTKLVNCILGDNSQLATLTTSGQFNNG